jgi:hypothetical protein
MLLQQRFWLVIGLLIFATVHVCGVSMLAAVSGTQRSAGIAITHNGD